MCMKKKCLFVLMLNVPVNNFSVISGRNEKKNEIKVKGTRIGLINLKPSLIFTDPMLTSKKETGFV